MADKKIFQIIIEETVSESFDVCADNIDMAIQIAQTKYKNGEFVLSPGNITDRKIFAIDKDTKFKKEWTDF